jgi:FtsH-binding integral membrane protein
MLRAWIAVMLLGNGWSVWRASAELIDRVTHGQTVWSPVFGYALPVIFGLGLLAIIGLIVVWRGRRIGALAVVAAGLGGLVAGVLLGMRSLALLINAAGLVVFVALIAWRWRALR